MERCTVNTRLPGNYFQQYSYYWYHILFSVCVSCQSQESQTIKRAFYQFQMPFHASKIVYTMHVHFGLKKILYCSLCIYFNFLFQMCVVQFVQLTFILAWIVAIYDHVYVLPIIVQYTRSCYPVLNFEFSSLLVFVKFCDELVLDLLAIIFSVFFITLKCDHIL